MTATAPAPEATDRLILSDFDGFTVVGTGVAITNAGDGLSAALKVDPQEFHHGQEVYVVLKTTVAKVAYVEVTKDDPDAGLRRVHSLRTEGATIVDKTLVEAQLKEQADKITAHKEREAGVKRLPGTAPDIEEHYDDGLDEFEPDRLGGDDDKEKTDG